MNKTVYDTFEGKSPELRISLDDGTDEKIAIIVVHKDRPELLNLCLQSIVVTSINHNIELIVVDNASTTKDALDYLDMLEKQPDIHLIRNDVNRWWATACNQGVKAADKRCKYYVFMHQDTVVLNPGWLDVLVSLSESQNSGFIGLEQADFRYDRQDLKYIREWCLMVSKDCWRDCGPFVDELKNAGSSFLMTVAAGRMGYNPLAMTKISLVHHYGAFSLDNSEYARMGEQSRALIPKLIRELGTKTKS